MQMMQNTLPVVLSVLIGFGAVVFYLGWISLRKKKNPIASCGILLLMVGFSGHGFLAAGEYDGRQEMMWKMGYSLVGIASLVGIGILAAKSRTTF